MSTAEKKKKKKTYFESKIALFRYVERAQSAECALHTGNPERRTLTTVDNGYIEHAGGKFWGSIYPLFDIYVDPFQRIYRIF